MFKRFTWEHGVLTIILIASAILNFVGLAKEGFGNTYYAAAVKSMMMNGHNFFFNSFDPNGFITIDKPPVDFWLQVLSASVFGYHGWALMLPQALAGVASVAVLYHLVQRIFGRNAGLIAAAVMAVTPIAVAVQRTNQVDGLLVLVMLLATWCLFRVIETGKLRWLIGMSVMEGIGFNVKMMEAYLILPALYVGYWIGIRYPWRKKVAHLLAMTAVLIAVSFSWAVIVDAVPANARPYVGSSQTNSEMELIFGYNGVSRLTGGAFAGHGRFGDRFRGGFGQFPGRSGQGFPSGGNGQFPKGGQSSTAKGSGSAFGAFGTGSATAKGGAAGNPFRFRQGRGFGGPGGAGGAGLFNTGTPGVLRLFQSELGGQIGWLLPFALLALIPLLRNVRWRREWTREEIGILIWAAWLLPMAVFFSIAGFFHQYYLITMAPGIAALVGAGLTILWRDLRHDATWKRYLPLAFLVNVAFECSLVWLYPSVRTPIIVGAVIAVALGALLLWKSTQSRALRAVGMTLAVIGLLVAPTYWSMTPMLYGVNGSMPAAGPSQGTSFGFGRDALNTALVSYLEKQYHAKPGAYLLATQNANTAAPIIVNTGLPVMAMGGFSGSDPAITVPTLQQLTQSGKLKFFLLGGGFGGQSSSAATRWIVSHSKLVPDSLWGGTTTTTSGFGGGGTLYEYVG